MRIWLGLVPDWGQAPVRGAIYGGKPRKFAIIVGLAGDCPQLGGSLAPQGILISRRAAESQREGLSPIGGSLALNENMARTGSRYPLYRLSLPSLIA